MPARQPEDIDKEFAQALNAFDGTWRAVTGLPFGANA
jgi:hypothetical protein